MVPVKPVPILMVGSNVICTSLSAIVRFSPGAMMMTYLPVVPMGNGMVTRSLTVPFMRYDHLLAAVTDWMRLIASVMSGNVSLTNKVKLESGLPVTRL